MLDFSITFFFTLINVGILFAILRAILFKPVTKFMDSRTGKIQKDLDQAETDKNQAKQLQHQYEEMVKNADEEAEAIIRAAREDATHQADRILQDVKEEAAQLLANARKQIEAEQQAALVAFKSEAGSLVIAAASRLIQRELKAEDSLRQAEFLLQEIGKN